MEPAWYLDAWDAAGGRAFASFRAALPRSESADFDPRQLCGDAAFLVRPPSFEIERIVNPTVGLAAGRSGLFLQRLAIREDVYKRQHRDDAPAQDHRRAGSGIDGSLLGGTHGDTSRGISAQRNRRHRAAWPTGVFAQLRSGAILSASIRGVGSSELQGVRVAIETNDATDNVVPGVEGLENPARVLATVNDIGLIRRRDYQSQRKLVFECLR